ncbi:hypothetical protein TBLA_0B03350 [Henningerozyma blattae CBS 6284]|uniref:Uncharacterized protein n=1 Tax=Henningerozyma blattae (strain ATCC 34711 / CBS 6284 / DSM 70876 / NBRC 10599 / NRRL Y-10934 / UCD 77-7) TaxID=1071380 RepID=I2GYH4_HENB6|nr:hypothetical protein TBLA_0B03350 [Tetrapisispora blattae CBS 6284]CCH59176.1 hypothetical protein TBLA_0B03350 [Tetrapisispora blattae CBS 6284]
MPLADFLETNIVGSSAEVKTWIISDWISIIVWSVIIGIYIKTYYISSILQQILLHFFNSNIYFTILTLNKRVARHTPFIGNKFLHFIRYIDDFNRNNCVSFFENFKRYLTLMFYNKLGRKMFVNKECVKIFMNEGNEKFDFIREDGTEDPFKSTLLICNHRSLVDYFVINHIVETFNIYDQEFSIWDITKTFWSKNTNNKKISPVSKLKFFTWGMLSNFPKFSLIKQILMKDENIVLNNKELVNNLKEKNNKIIVLFPEVNIISKELYLIQKKLNQDYFFLPKYKNLLYPRFNNFISIVKSFAQINRIKRTINNDYTNRNIINNNLRRIFSDNSSYHQENEENVVENSNKAEKHDNKKKGMDLFNQKTKSISLLLGMDPFAYENNESEQVVNQLKNDINEQSDVILNPDIYDITIVYFKLKYTPRAHDHNTGGFQIHDGIQLEQVNPSIFEMLRRDSKDNRPPLIICIGIKKYNSFNRLLPIRTKYLEKWLEERWIEKDVLITKMEKAINLTQSSAELSHPQTLLNP